MTTRLLIALGALAMVFISSCSKEETASDASALTFNGSIGEQDLLLFQKGAFLPGSLGYGSVASDVKLSSSTTNFGWGLEANGTPDGTITTQFLPNQAYTIVFFDSASRRKAYIARTILAANNLSDRPALRFFNCILSASSMVLVNDTNRTLLSGTAVGSFPSPSNETPFTPSFVHSGKVKLQSTTTGTALDSIENISLEANRFYSFFASGVEGATGVNKPRLHMVAH